MDTEIITAIIGAISGGGITQIGNIIFNRKKAKAEVKSDEIENMKKAMESFYGPLVEQQNKRIADLTNENESLRRTISEQQRQIASLQEQIAGIYKLLGKDSQKALRAERNGRSSKPSDIAKEER